MAARRLLSRRAHCLLLVTHVCGAVGWIAVLAAVVVLDIALILWVPHLAVIGQAGGSALDTLSWLRGALTFWVLVPAVFVCLASGTRLACVYATPRPRWLSAKIGLTLVVLTLASAVLAGMVSMPGPLLTARSTGLGTLAIILVVSVAKPGRRRRGGPRIMIPSPTVARPRPTGSKGRHRK